MNRFVSIFMSGLVLALFVFGGPGRAQMPQPPVPPTPPSPQPPEPNPGAGAMLAPPMPQPAALPTPGGVPSLPTPPMVPWSPPHTDASASVPPARVEAKKGDAPVVEQAAIPQPLPRSRYEESWKKNPFMLKVAPVMQTKETWSTDYALMSIAKSGSTYRVSIKNKKTGETKRLTQGDDGKDPEFKLLNVDLQRDRKSSSVEVEHAGEKAKLTYDEQMLAAQPRGAGAAGARPGMPTIPGQPGSAVPMPNIRTSATAGGRPGGVTGTTMPPMPVASAGAQPHVTGGQGYMGGSPGYMGGGGVAPGPAGSPATTAAGSPAGASSRLGALGPRAAGSAQGSGLVPVVGGTRVATNTTGTTADTAVVNPGNVVIDATTSASTGTPGTTSTVTRRRTLIPAPVVNQ